MSPRDALSALVAALALGLAFIAIKIGVREAPPMLLTALRFAFAAVPAVFFVPPPKAKAWLVALYGLLIGVGQFGLLFLAIGHGMPIGLASLVIQLQAFITILLAWIALGERPSAVQVTAASLALLGIVVIGSTRLGGASLWPFLMVTAAALCWGGGNIVGKLAGRIDMFAFTIWSSLAAPLPLLALSIYFDGLRAVQALSHPSWVLALCVAGLAYGATILGFGLWSRLLAHYPASQVAPFALLIPVVGMISGWLFFSEPLRPLEFVGALLIMAGLSFNVFGQRLLAYRFRLIG
ncbi:EamA family transporter [Methylocapsa aurea]|uniref:EamA family transporter n=1 Tax=Methylocapsa aurea TaxID=663610 RepID=UPI00055CCD6E|nr:EamA family transporter [Methylocapsa aurea]